MAASAVAAVVATAACVCCANAQAVTFVDENGQPNGGVYQQWADQSKMPTYAGDVQLITHSFGPGCPVACSAVQGSVILPNGATVRVDGPSPPEIFVVPGLVSRFDLYWELGHQFDWHDLTDGQRQLFATVWRSTVPWWNTLKAEAAGYEDGLEGVFSSVYAECALGQAPTGNSWVMLPPQADVSQDVCQAIAAIGAAVGAAVPVLPPTVSKVKITQQRRRRRREPVTVVVVRSFPRKGT